VRNWPSHGESKVRSVLGLAWRAPLSPELHSRRSLLRSMICLFRLLLVPTQRGWVCAHRSCRAVGVCWRPPDSKHKGLGGANLSSLAQDTSSGWVLPSCLLCSSWQQKRSQRLTYVHSSSLRLVVDICICFLFSGSIWCPLIVPLARCLRQLGSQVQVHHPLSRMLETD
jgi:hypothetical protein